MIYNSSKKRLLVPTFSSGILLALMGTILQGCVKNSASDDERKAMSIRDARYFYKKGLGTPAEFATRKRCLCIRQSAVLNNKVSTRENAITTLAKWYDEAKKGFNWHLPSTQINIPFLSIPPHIDGVISPGEWKDAYSFKGEYQIDSKIPEKNSSALWYVGRDSSNLYFAAKFDDSSITLYPGDSFAKKSIYTGDSVELFIRPTKETIYYEYIINPNCRLWAWKHAIRKYGGNIIIEGVGTVTVPKVNRIGQARKKRKKVS